MGSGVGGLAACAARSGRDVAPEESFTRFQLAAIIDSSVRRIWRLGWLAGWAGLDWAGLGWLAGWLLHDFL